MAKVLLVDTAFSSVPIYNFLVGQKHDVYVVGNRSQDPLAIRAGKKWIEQDYSRLAEVERIVSEHAFNYIVPGCTDLSIEICQSLMAYSDHFDDPEVYQYLGHKECFRKMCLNLGLTSPQIKELSDFPLSGRFICKPVDSFSGRGVSVVDGNDLEAVQHAYELAKAESISDSALIETYVSGQLYSYSVFIENNIVIESFIVCEGASANPYAVDTSYLDEKFNIEIEKQLKESIEAIAGHLQLKNGLIHVQFILSDGQPYLIEITRRCPGDLYSKLIEYGSGFDYAGKFASYFVNKPYHTIRKYNESIIRHTVTADESVNYEVLEFISPLNVKAFYPLLSLGEVVLPKQKTRVGILFTHVEDKGKSYQEIMSRGKYNLVS